LRLIRTPLDCWRFVDTPEAEFSVSAQIEPPDHRRVERTQQQGLLDIGFWLAQNDGELDILERALQKTIALQEGGSRPLMRRQPR
jgi:hypothetical protein